ncbi:hypothetical protein LTR53_019771, partial [Teratosphaeriaceae sp. CCFEE 6253]
MKSPSRPRPPKPIQPRDDGQSRHATVREGSPSSGSSRLAFSGPQPRDDGSNVCLSKPAPRPPKPVVPRDSGSKRRRERDPKDPTPRDP